MSKIPWENVMTLTWMDGAKLLISALVILFVTKIQLFHDRLSALLIALPLTSLLAIIWMRAEGQGSDRIANHAEATFWFVLPSLPMFLLIPWMLRQGSSFWIALAAGCALTVALYFIMVLFGPRVGIRI